MRHRLLMLLTVLSVLVIVACASFWEKGRWFEPYIHRSDTKGYEMSQVGSARHDYTKSSWTDWSLALVCPEP